LVPEAHRIDDEALAREVRERGFAFEPGIGAEGCVRCHPDVVAQWEASAHRFSSFNNPFYEATIESLRTQQGTGDPWMRRHLSTFGLPDERVGAQRSQWCGACHDPALLFTGAMGEPIPRESPAAQAGLTCMACHGIDRIHDLTGNGNYNLNDLRDDPYLFAGANGGLRALLHDAALKARPAAHRLRLLKPIFKEPEYCLSCHKVSLAEPLNEYRWLRGQNEYDNWHDSGVSLNASRTFYLPAERRICQDCHMPPEPAPLGDLAAEAGTVRSHRFLAANTALPFLRGDSASLRRIEAFLRDEKLSVDVFALRRLSTGETTMDLGPEGATVPPGEQVRVDVVVRNRGVGHTFPGGTTDSNEGWLEVTILDDAGEVLARSGALLSDGSLDPSAHAYKAVLLDSAGEAIHDRNGARIHVTAAVNVIGPGTADVAHYGFRVPQASERRSLRVRARLLWRKFDRSYTRFAHEQNPAGFVGHAAPPDLPVTEIAADEVTLRVTDERERAAAAGSTWEAFNDYGIALLLRGNTFEAREAFERVASDAAGAFEGHLSLARVALRDGNLDLAFQHLDRAEALRPGDARAAWIWGTALQEEGRYADAADAYSYVLESFPADRAAWRNLGRTLYLARRYDEALDAFDAVLAIDPEDRVSHYHRMLSLRALGRVDEATLAEAAYERFRIDESAQAVAGGFRAANPGVNLTYQPIHTHDLVIPGS
jgi:tetratricopeptide (TPR) repeat protein/nitrate/TMAO reductase-like tetraheme cytochrome c subunit